MAKGYIQERGNGKFQLVVDTGRNIGGKRVRKSKTVTAKGSREAEKALALFIADLERGEAADAGKMTVAGLIRQWKESHLPELSPRTAHRYGDILKRIEAGLGKYPLKDLKPIDVNQFVAWLKKQPREDKKEGALSDRTVHHHFRVLHTLLQHAADLQLLPKNPAHPVAAPKVVPREMRILAPEDLQKTLKALPGEPIRFQAMILVALTTGLRRGELFGLQWPDIDFEAETMSISKSISYVPKKPMIVKAPKTKGSLRKVALDPLVLGVLRKWKAEQNKIRLLLGERWKEKIPWAFTTDTGALMHLDNAHAQWTKFQRRCGVEEPISFHALRHQSATIMLSNGIPIKAVSGRLGHSTVTTTLNTYAHLFQDADREAAAVFGDILKPAAG